MVKRTLFTLALALTLAVPAQAKWTFTCKTALLATFAISLGCGVFGPCVRDHLHQKQLVSVESKPLIVGGQPVKLKHSDFRDAAELLVKHILLRSGIEPESRLVRVREWLLRDDKSTGGAIRTALTQRGIAPEILEDHEAFIAQFSDCNDPLLQDLLAVAMGKVHEKMVANNQATGLGTGLALAKRDISDLALVNFVYVYTNAGDAAFEPIQRRVFTLTNDEERRTEAERVALAYFASARKGPQEAPFDSPQNLEEAVFRELQRMSQPPIRPSAETADSVLERLHEQMMKAHLQKYQASWKAEADPSQELALINAKRQRHRMEPLVYSEGLSRHCAMVGPRLQRAVDISRTSYATGSEMESAESLRDGIEKLVSSRNSDELFLNPDARKVGFVFYDGRIYVVVTR